MLKSRGYELRLPADWPPASVTVNGVAIKQAGPTGAKADGASRATRSPRSFPSPNGALPARVTIEVRRAAGLTARRDELDGFAGAMTRLRGAYDALQKTWPVSAPPDPLIDAMQTGDRLGYHPERATEEMAHFHEVLPKAQAVVNTMQQGFAQRLDEFAKRLSADQQRSNDLQAQKQIRLDAIARAQKLIEDVK